MVPGIVTESLFLETPKVVPDYSVLITRRSPVYTVSVVKSSLFIENLNKTGLMLGQVVGNMIFPMEILKIIIYNMQALSDTRCEV